MSRFVRLAALSAAVVTVASLPHRAGAQDIVEAGRIHGVELPASGRQILARDPTAFEFRRAMKSKLRSAQIVRGTRRGLLPSYGPNGAASAASTSTSSGPLRGPHIGDGPVVNGTEKVAVLPIRYANTAAEPWAASNLQQRLFTGPSGSETLTELYTEMSRGNLTMTGTVYPWTSVPGSDADYEGAAGNNGLGGAGLWNLLKATLDAADATIDFSQYDDDHDGYVDLVAFVQPESGGECGGGSNNMWSHRWVVEGAASQAKGPSDVIANGYLTNDGVRISDYVLQPALNCGVPASPISIGVFAHEFGHALGLPDLYPTSSTAAGEGIGGWGLMGAGNWNIPTSPAHMEAWSKMQLGWVPVQTITTDQAHVVMDPIETTGSIIRLNIPGTTEYFLLENRQRLGSDVALKGTGLLIWHVDSATIIEKWPTNSIQNVTTHKGLDLVEADGLARLDKDGYRGGAGDPFPGSSGVTSWTLTTSPNSNGYGRTSGISITNIVESNQQISFDISFVPPGAIAVKWGDIDGDGVVGNSDVAAIYGCFSDGTCATLPGISRADVDADGQATMRDGLIIHSYVVGGVDVARFRVGQTVAGTAPAVKVSKAGVVAGAKPAIVPRPGTP